MLARVALATMRARRKIIIAYPLHIREYHIKPGWHGKIIRKRDNGLGDVLLEVEIQEKPISVLLREQEFFVQDDDAQRN